MFQSYSNQAVPGYDILRLHRPTMSRSGDDIRTQPATGMNSFQAPYTAAPIQSFYNTMVPTIPAYYPVTNLRQNQSKFEHLQVYRGQL